jgi:hypothetical protein
LRFHYRKSKIGDILDKTGNVHIAQHWDAFVQTFLQWKAISIMYSECVFVVLGTQHAPFCHCGPPGSTTLFHIISKNGTVSEREKKYWTWNVFIFSTTLVWNISHITKKNWARYGEKCTPVFM